MMLSPNFWEAKLHTHFVDEYRKEIMDNMAKIIQKDKEMETRLKSTFLPSKRVAAISAAVNSHLASTLANNKK